MLTYDPLILFCITVSPLLPLSFHRHFHNTRLSSAVAPIPSRSSTAIDGEKSSSSSFSRAIDLNLYGYYLLGGGEKQGIEIKTYSLWDIFKELNLKSVDHNLEHVDYMIANSMSVSKGNSDSVGKVCFEKILEDCRLSGDWMVLKTVALPLPDSDNQADIVSSNLKLPDIQIVKKSNFKEISQVAEIQSSPMLWTERKSVLVATDLFRNLRENTELDYVEVFALPNLTNKQCITSIKVSIKSLKFLVTLKRFPEIKQGIEYMKSQIKLKCSQVLPITSIVRHLVKLTKIELHNAAALVASEAGATFEEYQPPKQLYSTSHILFLSKNTVYKVIHTFDDTRSIMIVQKAFGRTAPTLTVNVQTCSLVPMVVKYNYVPYHCFSKDEARLCFKEFMLCLKAALDELHGMNIAHNDVRMENVLFSSNFTPVFIDVDRASLSDPTKFAHDLFRSITHSCMYNLDHSTWRDDGARTDLFQLGWMAAWILNTSTSSSSYHSREWRTEPDEIRTNKFVESLITSGKFKSELLEDCVSEVKTIEQVLLAR